MPPKKSIVEGLAKPTSKAASRPHFSSAEKRWPDDSKHEPSKKVARRGADTDVEQEREADDLPDKRPVNKENISFNPIDTTLNVIPTEGGKVLMALTDGGMQYLIAGARANVGMKSGRYFYEVKIVEALNPAEASAGGTRARTPAPRQLLRMGFSTGHSALILGDSENHIYFDSEGNYCCGKRKTQSASQRFMRDQVIGVLLNLDANIPNANTISLFRQGERISEPQSIPEHFIGQTLFPHVSFRNVSVQVQLGREALKQLPFKCRTIGNAAEADIEVNTTSVAADGKYEVVLPIAFPDEGTFDWLDDFLIKNPNYIELSDRKILEWAGSSGLWKPKAAGWKTSNDKPEFSFGLPGMDDQSVRRVVQTITSVVPRNYVVMEVRGNLLENERKEVLRRYSHPMFKKVAHVVMGEPGQEFKEMQLEKLLNEKQEKANVGWKAKKAEESRKRAIEQRHKVLAEMKRKAEHGRRKAADDARRRADANRRRKNRIAEARKMAEDMGEDFVSEDEGMDSETREDDRVDDVEDAKDEIKVEDDAEDQDVADDPPKVELTEEEKQIWFRPPSGGCSDLTLAALNQSFGSFSIPEVNSGFDEFRYEWQGDADSREYLSSWVMERKRTSRIEDLQPGQWFLDQMKEWQKLFQEWQDAQKDFKTAQKSIEGSKDDEDESFEIDIDSVENVIDIGNGEPLFKDFAFEDWALLQLRFELWLLQVAFRRDVEDPERVGVHENHLAFYYSKYFRKQIVPKAFAVSAMPDIVGLVKDCIGWHPEEGVLTTTLPNEMPSFTPFVKVAEESRRERQRRIDAGDETARISFSPMAMQQPSASKSSGISGGWPGGTGSKQWGSAKAGSIFQGSGIRPVGYSGATGSGNWAKRW